jgi:hypothetical protein
MLLLALFLGLFFVSGQTLFNTGGSVPGTGMGTVVQAPPATKTPTAPGRAMLSIRPSVPVTTIVGTGFKSGELVRVTGVPTAPRVRASAQGRFTIRLRSVNPCNGLTVVAVGNKGSRAAVNYSQVYCAVP